MPETTKIRCGGSWRSEQAWKSAFRTPKSPHPGHQSGGTSDLKSFMVGGAAVVDMSCSFKAPWTSWLRGHHSALCRRVRLASADGFVLASREEPRRAAMGGDGRLETRCAAGGWKGDRHRTWSREEDPAAWSHSGGLRGSPRPFRPAGKPASRPAQSPLVPVGCSVFHPG